MSSALKLTVLIPTYNRSSRLNRSLPAYLSNKRKDIEFFIVDNCSPDDTETTVKKWMKKDRRIRYFKQYTNVGANRSLFIGMLLSKAPLVMIMPDDDYMTKGFIDVVIRKFEEHPEVAIIHSSMYDERNRLGIDSSAFYAKGPDAIRKFFMLAGAIIGMSFRKKSIDFDSWKLDNRMYPQVLAGCKICLNHDIYLLEGMNDYVKAGTDDNSIQIASSRPKDYGVFERMEIIREITESYRGMARVKLRTSLKLQLLGWAASVYLEMYPLNRTVAKEYLRTLLAKSSVYRSLVLWYVFFNYVFPSAKIRIVDKLSIFLRIVSHLPETLLGKEMYEEVFLLISRPFR